MTDVKVEKILKTIKAIRESLNFSQAKVAKEAGISTSFYGMIERGDRSLSVEHLIKIAEVFECNITDLLDIAENS